MFSMRRVRAASKPSSPALLPFVQNTLGEGRKLLLINLIHLLQIILMTIFRFKIF